jgi:hypothetical protein
MDAGSWPPAPPRPDAPPPRPDGAAAWPPPAPPREPPRRRRGGLVVVAALLAIALLAAAVGSFGGGSSGRYLAVGGQGRYRFLRQTPDGQPYRWDPCVPIHYEVNLADAPPGALGEVRHAIERVADVTDYRFVYDGPTVRTADQQIGTAFQSGATTSRWLPVLITWVPRAHFDYLADTHRAAAFGMPKTGDGEQHALYESGLIAVDAGGHLPPGFDARYSEGVVLMHELGHVMGLAHVGDGDELMWSPDVKGADRNPDLGLHDWGPGDLRGLEILDRHATC